MTDHERRLVLRGMSIARGLLEIQVVHTTLSFALIRRVSPMPGI